MSETAPSWSPSSEPSVTRAEQQDDLDDRLDLASIEVPATRDLLADGFEGSFPGAWSVFDDQGAPVTQAASALSRAQAYEGSQSATCTGSGDRAGASSWRVHGPFSLSEASSGTFYYRYWISSDSSATNSVRFLVSIDGSNFHGARVSGSSHGWKSGSIDLAAVPGLGDVTGLPEVWIAAVLPCGNPAAGEAAFVDDVRVRKTTLTAGSDIRITPLNLTFTQTTTRPIFVEIDWMEDGTHSHKPSQAVLDRIAQTFAMAGFKITFDVSNAITHQATLAITTSPSGSSAFTSIRSANFNHASDNRYYYSLWGHNYSYNGTFTTSSGIADFPPGQSHLISLGSFPGQTGTFSHQVGTFIHEFGHNINQRHGGGDDENYKPNYLGVMNYHYQLAGVGPTLLALGFANTGSGFDDFAYSHGLMPSLNENSLNESLGVGLGKAVDWNCSGTFTTGLVKDIQASNPCTASGPRSTLSDFDNWTSLANQIRTFSTIEAESPPIVETCATWEEHLPLHRKIERLRSLGLLPPDGPSPASETAEAGMNASFFTIFNDGTDPLNVTSMALNVPTTWVEWEPQAPFTVPAGGSQKVHVYVDFGQAVGGTTTRQIVVQSNDPDENPYPGGVFLSITSTNPIPCFALTRSHTGSGSDPVATPANSTGCSASQYVAGASISLTATPSAGSQVAGWTGTTNDASTATTNTVTMPAANQTVSVAYALSCYTLTLSHTGSGGDPVVTPTNSAGCAVGSYNSGASISLTASPSAGSQVAGWSGTTNNASTATTNTVTMPVGNHTVSVAYALSCYTLTLSHTGSGSDPVATPTNSAGCAVGSYNSGASISVTASPSAGSQVSGWSGTTNNASTATTNTVTMPIGSHTVSVQYALSCYTMTRSHSGSGSDPVATPGNSAGCATGQYNAGASINLAASPSAGSQVAGWSGTANDASTATTNTLTMPVGNQSVSVQYTLSCYTLTRSHSGSGSDPGASPPNSAGCAAGQYNAGASINLLASPAADFAVAGWTGTSNDASLSTLNSLIMPFGNHSVAVQYVAVPDVALSNGVAQAGSFTADSALGTWRYYYVDLDAGDTRLVIDLAGMNQDVNLYVRFGAKPTASTYDCRPQLGGTADEQCSFPAPGAGRWWIGVNNVATGSLTYQLTARWLIPDMDFYTITPCRAVDTRTGPPLLSGVSATLAIAGTCQIPSTARAIAYNVTVLSPTSNGNVVLWPADLVKPLTSSINYAAGDIRANNGMVALATDGSGNLKAEGFLAGGGSVHVTIDITGYFQ